MATSDWSGWHWLGHMQVSSGFPLLSGFEWKQLKKYRKGPIALSCQRREGCAREIGEEMRGENPCTDTANEDIAEAGSKPRDLSVVARTTGGWCQGSMQHRAGAEGNLGTLERKQ